ncbi:MAG: hypothetical protein AAF456_24365 [Planctomycetota bacterium]
MNISGLYFTRLLMLFGSLIYIFPSVARADVFLNPGFELSGILGSGDSANWEESGLFGASIRDTTNPNTGAAAHKLGGLVSAGFGDGSIVQNSLDQGAVPLNPGDVLVAEFWASTDINTSLNAGADYQFDIVDDSGNVIVSTGLMPLPSSTTGYQLFDSSSNPLTVPSTPGNYGAQLTVNARHGNTASTVTVTVFVDDVRVYSVPEPGTAMFLCAILCSCSIRRTRKQQ